MPVKKCLFCGLFSAMLFHIFILSVSDFTFKLAPKCSAKVLSSVSKDWKAALCLIKEICVR